MFEEEEEDDDSDFLFDNDGMPATEKGTKKAKRTKANAEASAEEASPAAAAASGNAGFCPWHLALMDIPAARPRIRALTRSVPWQRTPLP